MEYYKSLKTEIRFNNTQRTQYFKTIGVCRFVYNLYLNQIIEHYKNTNKFLSAYEFEKYLNHIYLKDNPDKKWIKEVSQKAVKQSILNCETAFKNFFREFKKNKKAGYPKYKKRGKNDCSYYAFVNIHVKNNKIKVPLLNWIKIKEKGYITEDLNIVNIHIDYKAGRFFISVLVKIEKQSNPIQENINEPIGIDLGINKFATLSNGTIYKNINKVKKVIKLNKSIKHQQKSLSRKLEIKKKGKSQSIKNIEKNILKIQCLFLRKSNIKIDYLNQIINEIVKTKPSKIVLEDLNIKWMLKNRHLSRAISEQSFYDFRNKLEQKCKELGIKVITANRFYPSSKKCSKCGYVHKDLKLKDRVFICPSCGFEIDRDLNASINLKNYSNTG